ncbi:MAG: hypothetical protein NT038_03840 [Euryarchaeota archaeon]|nr:hypothetical protein [Euryarchaeota archaeon]
MCEKKKLIWNLIFPLMVWGVIASYALSNPVPREPDNVPTDAWSYYNGHPPAEQFLIKNRDVLLVALFVCSVAIGLLLWVFKY